MQKHTTFCQDIDQLDNAGAHIGFAINDDGVNAGSEASLNEDEKSILA